MASKKAAGNKSFAELLRDKHKIAASSFQSDLFSEEPVPLDVFVQDKRYLGNPPLFPKQYENVRQLERIFFQDTYVNMVEEFGPYWAPTPMKNFIYAEWGKGSGKDHFCRIGAARVAYLLCCLKDPQAYYKVAPQDIIHTINVATTAQQARGAFFMALGNLLKISPWFKEHVVSEITPNSTGILLDRQVEMISGHSLAESFEGLNPILAVADEIAGFRAEDEMQAVRGAMRAPTKTAEEILKVLRSSARSRYPEVFKMVAISYPRYLGDPIENLMRLGNKDIEEKGPDASRYWCSGPFATWEINPKIKGPEDFQEDYDNDPEQARGTYECKPQRSANRFFRNDVVMANSFLTREEDPPVTFEYYWGQNDKEDTLPGETPGWGWQMKVHFAPDFKPYEGALYAIHADMALSYDRAGLSVAHVRTWQHEADDARQNDDRPVVKVDLVTAWEADLTAMAPDGSMVAREVQQRWVRKFMRAMIERGFSFGLLTMDGWQSLDTLQMVTAWGIEAKVQSIDRTIEPYMTLKDVLYDGRLEAYDDGVVVKELEGLTKLKNGKIDHPAKGSKDEADALAGAVMGAIAIGGSEGDWGEERIESTFNGVIDLSVGGGFGGGFGPENLSLSGDFASLGWNS